MKPQECPKKIKVKKCNYVLPKKNKTNTNKTNTAENYYNIRK